MDLILLPGKKGLSRFVTSAKRWGTILSIHRMKHENSSKLLFSVIQISFQETLS